MAVKLMSVNGVSNCRQAKYIVDSENDIYDIPEEDLVMGTEIYIIESGQTIFVGSEIEESGFDNEETSDE
ncbi:MAG: hypothetical protein IKU01_01510 [Bacteroidales bacterium]|nr:hypothetical protein [Bacteroidales bacterium]